MIRTDKRTGWLLLGVALIAYSACRTSFPAFPRDYYDRVEKNYTRPCMLTADSGYYRLDVYRYDTVFARENLQVYTTEMNEDRRNLQKVDSIYLYFIDPYRFYYSKKKRDKIDIAKDTGKGVRVGLYSMYHRTLGDKTYSILLLQSSLASVKDPYRFDFANIYLERRADGSLAFLSAEYPVQMADRREPNMSGGDGTFFSSDAVSEAWNAISDSGIRIFESEDMKFRAVWRFEPAEVLLSIAGQAFDSLRYVTPAGGPILRKYYFGGVQVAEEQISVNPGSRVSW